MNVKDPRYVILFTAAITCAFTAVVMTVQVATAGKIQRNEDLRFEKALVEVFNLAAGRQITSEEISQMVSSRIERGRIVRDPQTGRGFEVIRAYRSDTTSGTAREDSELLGIAFQISGNGFWAPISGLMSLSPDLGEVLGVVFLDHKETPGLGGRITEQWFQEQFRGLNAQPPPAAGKFIYISKYRPIRPTEPGYGRTVDAITGATQTSMAVEKFINANLAQFRRAMQAGTAKPDDERQD